MKTAVLLGLLFFSTIAYCQKAISYAFAMDTSIAKAAVLVSLKFQGSKTGKTFLRFPERWAGETDLHRAVSGLVVTNGVTIDTTNKPHVKTLTHKPGETITVEYRLTQDWVGEELRYPQNYRAVINKNYIHLTGYSLLLFPDMGDTENVKIDLDWTKMPANWQIANSLHTGNRKYSGKIMMKDFVNSLFVAGDYRLSVTKINNQPVHLAIRTSGWKYSDSALLGAIQKVITAERNFWNDHSEPYYLVTMTPFAGQGSYNGSALHQAFMTSMSKEFPLDVYLYSLLSHEYFHRWNGIMITMKGNEQENTWLGEGFTEYYTWKLLHKARLISFDEYLAAVNRSISDYYLSPVRNEKISAIAKNFWTDRTYQQLPYKKGFTYALYLDAIISQASAGKNSLDNIMFDLQRAVLFKTEITESLFVAIVSKYAGPEISSRHYDFIREGNTIPVHRLSLGDSISYVTKQMGRFDPGFNLNPSLKAKKISGVVLNSEAWKAGLRDGQTIKKWSVYYDNIMVPLEITVIDESGNDKTISYYPMSELRVEVPQFEKKFN